MIKVLLKAGADKKAKDAEGHTPLHVACFGGHVAVVKMLLKADADIEAKDDYGFTPFHVAC